MSLSLRERRGFPVLTTIIITLLICGAAFGMAIQSGSIVFASGMPDPNVQEVIVKEYGTLGPEIIKSYIMKHGPQMYSRLADEFVTSIYKNSEEYKLSPILLTALMRAESEYCIFAKSKTGALGAMQIQPNIWDGSLREKGIIKQEGDYFDPTTNISAGTFILRHYTDETKDFSLALNKYLGDDHKPYRDKIAKYVGEIMVLGITEEIDANYSLK